MATSPALSPSAQKTLLDVIAEQKKQLAKRAKTHARWTAGLAVAAAILFIACPPVGLLALAAPVAVGAAAFGGALMVGDKVTARNLEQAVDGVAGEGLVEKLRKKTDGLKKLAKIADGISTAAVFAIAGTFVAGLLFPPAAPLALTIFNVAVWPMALGGMVNSTVRDISREAAVTSLTAGSAAHAPAAEDTAPLLKITVSPSRPGPTSTLSLKSDFTGAHTATTPPAKTPANDAAPAPKKNPAP